MASFGSSRGQLAAEPARPHRLVLVGQVGDHLVPFGDVRLGLIEPGLALARRRFRCQRGEPGGDVAQDTDGAGIITAELDRIDVDLDHLDAGLGHPPGVGRHVAGAGAGEDDQVGLADDVIGRTRAIRADRA